MLVRTSNVLAATLIGSAILVIIMARSALSVLQDNLLRGVRLIAYLCYESMAGAYALPSWPPSTPWEAYIFALLIPFILRFWLL